MHTGEGRVWWILKGLTGCNLGNELPHFPLSSSEPPPSYEECVGNQAPSVPPLSQDKARQALMREINKRWFVSWSPAIEFEFVRMAPSTAYRVSYLLCLHLRIPHMRVNFLARWDVVFLCCSMSYSLSLSRGGWDGRIHHTLVRRRMTSLVPRWGEGPGVRLEDEKCLFCQCTMENQPVCSC